jgi:hypothetical protein
VVVCDVDENGGFQEPAVGESGGAFAAGGQSGAVGVSCGDEGFDAVAVRRGGQRTNLGGVVQGAPHGQGTRKVGEEVDKLVIAGLRDEHPRPQEAGLTVVEQGGGEQPFGHRRFVEFGVVEDDGR